VEAKDAQSKLVATCNEDDQSSSGDDTHALLQSNKVQSNRIELLTETADPNTPNTAGAIPKHLQPKQVHPDMTAGIDVNMAQSSMRTPSWDGLSALGSDGSHGCHHSPISGSFLGGGSAPKMCLRDYPDLVSDAIKARGMWQDCPQLAALWTSLPDRSQQVGAGHGKLYVDIGANIGACLLPMMARPDVEDALAFEPSPRNLFYLTNSILANPETKKKVTLYPVALGNESVTMPVYEESGNAGNTVVGQATHTSNQPLARSVEVRKLDDIVMDGPKPPYVHLMKMDAQGFEVNILHGGSRLLASGAVNAVKFELATDWLVKQGTSSAEYLNTYMSYGFQIYDTDTQHLVNQEDLHAVACGPPLVKDYLAIHVDKTEIATQETVVC